MGVVDDAITWIVGIANDNSHGYDWGGRGPDYDCSGLVITAYAQAGLPVVANGATYTGNMKDAFVACGFRADPYVNGYDLQPGDVLLNTAHHTAMFIGNGQLVEASSNENYGIEGRDWYKNGQTGDQTSKEIKIRDFYVYGRGWDYVLHYKYDTASEYEQIAPSSTTCNPMDYTRMTGSYGIKVYSDVRNEAPNDRHDMTIREICYFSDKGTFVTGKTNIYISAINYTTLLGNLYDSFAQYYPDGYETDITHFEGSIFNALDYFINKGMNPAASAGIVACLFEWSGIGTNNAGRGICGWEGKYKRDMHQKVEDWKTNLTGQLDYLWSDLTLNYNTMVQLLNNMPVTTNGARQAGYRFWVSYRYTDQPQDVDSELSATAAIQNRAADWFSDIIITPIESEGTSYSMPTSVTIPIGGLYEDSDYVLDSGGNYAGNAPVTDTTPTVNNGTVSLSYPDSCPYVQRGIDGNYMSYSYYGAGDHFGGGSLQKKLAQIWREQFNYSCDRNVATINGYYLIATGQIFGSVGDRLLIYLEPDGNADTPDIINAMIADMKNPADNNDIAFGTVWGHVYKADNKLNIIEWQAVDVVDDKAVASSSHYLSSGNSVNLEGIGGRKISYIKNIGKMFPL